MINRMRKRFIRIAVLSVTAVMFLLTIIVNTANMVSTNIDLKNMLDIIYENQGSIPKHIVPPSGEGFDADKKNENMQDEPLRGYGEAFNQETPYSTRYFYVRFNDEGILDSADFEHIAAVTENDASEYISEALEHGEGYGYFSGYKYRVIKHGEGRYMAIFLDCYTEMRAVKNVVLWSLSADVFCVVLVYVLVVFFSKKAMEPMVRASQRQKQFITDAGHELKTPITVIATSLRVLEMETGKQKWIDKAMAQTEKLKNLVNSLVTLSKMDEEESPLRFEEFSISEAVEETAESFADYAESRGHELNISIAEGVKYRGDEYAVRQLVSILLDNAVKYAVVNTPISVFMKKTGKGVRLGTSNKCEGIDVSETEKLFDRFYRADKSRSSENGFGIGLSVARSIAEGHGGSIKARLDRNNIEFIVELR